MKKYLLFAGDTYYPAGGWFDFRGSFDDVEAAKAQLGSIDHDWWHVVDSSLRPTSIPGVMRVSEIVIGWKTSFDGTEESREIGTEAKR